MTSTSLRTAIHAVLDTSSPEELESALRTAGDGEAMDVLLAVAGLVREKMHLARQLEDLSRLDSFTGLPNRRAFDERLDLELRRSARSRKSFALAMLSVEAQPPALLPVAGAIRNQARSADFAARADENRFAVLLVDVDRSSARAVAERLLGVVQNAAAGASPFQVAAGVALSFPVDNAETIIERAEAALYEAKQQGNGAARFT